MFEIEQCSYHRAETLASTQHRKFRGMKDLVRVGLSFPAQYTMYKFVVDKPNLYTGVLMYYWCFKQRNIAWRTVDREIRTWELREDIFIKVKVKADCWCMQFNICMCVTHNLRRIIYSENIRKITISFPVIGKMIKL